MSSRRFPVTVEPAGITVWAPEGVTVLEAARSAGVMIPAPCGGRGVCGKCAIKLTQGVPAPPDDEERVGLKSAPKGVRLACRMKVTGPLSFKPLVPTRSSESAGELVADEPLVAGVDLGTTTVSAVILGKHSRRQLGRATVSNRQGVFGADVLSRVAAWMSGDSVAIHDAALESVRDALCAACGRACACLDDIERLVVTGNSVMTSSLMAEELDGFSAHPFDPPFRDPRSLPEGWQGDRGLSDSFESIVLPPVASFVGGDTSTALLAAGLLESDKPCLLVDMGTNAEVAVVSGGALSMTSAAAGPALEAGGISSGGPYGEGAVTSVNIDGSAVALDTEGGVEPIWLAGSGLVSAIAALRRSGHLDVAGAMHESGPLSERFTTIDDVRALILAGSEESGIVLTQMDVRAFQQAKAGVAVAVYMLARSTRLKPRKVGRLVVTGALGISTVPDDLVELGILPEDLEDVMESVEAAALTGAGMIASDPGLMDDVTAVTSKASYFDLAQSKEFTDTFMSALALEPYTLKKGF